MKKIRDIFSGNEGFTLIELLIVIVILGVLAAIAVPNLMGLTDSANKEAVRANMRTLLTEIEAEKIKSSANRTVLTSLNAYTETNNMDNVSISDNNSDSSYSDYSFTATPSEGSWEVTITNGTLNTSGY